MSFLSRLFGGSKAASGESPEVATTESEYKGFTIRALPRKDGGQYLVAGTIEKTIGGALKQHHFVRADRSPDRDEISEMALMKARLMIDQQGETLFG